ncbi:Hef nuclease, partial [Candidatus Woesearchaeota archaeon]|nr:Hef nuclease [Candidatus Woesearchaeota archaeon]
SRMKFANTYLAKNFIETSLYKRILALTASPGGTKTKIQEICSNLFIDNVEIRTETDQDVLPYVQEKNVQWIQVGLSEEYQRIIELLKDDYNEKLKRIKSYGFSKPISLINRRDLLQLQIRFQKEIQQKKLSAFQKISTVAQGLKLSYMIELMETQGLYTTRKYIDKLKKESSKASRIITSSNNFLLAISILDNLTKEHPKIQRLKEIISEEIKQNPKTKIIVFANYRDTVSNIVDELKKMEIDAAKLIGQKSGLTQKEQIRIVREFGEGNYKVLVGTQILEEGIDVPGGANMAVFYDSVPSDIRKIQRAGRVGRLKTGKIIFLITKNTRDEAYFWAGHHKEKRMKRMLYALSGGEVQKLLEN